MRRSNLSGLGWLSGVLVVAGLTATGCGGGGSGDVPENSVAKVDDVPVKLATYRAVHPSTVIANPNKQQAQIAAMQIVLQREWAKQEAKAQDVDVTDAEVRQALKEQKAQFFKSEKAYEKFLRRSKRSEADLYAGMLQKLQMDDLSAKAVKQAPRIDDQRVVEYYGKNRKEFALPQRYEMRTLIAKTEAKAKEAEQAIDDGKSWEQATSEYSPKGINTEDSAKYREVSKTGLKEFDKALASMKAGDRTIVKTQYGWILIDVKRVLPAGQRTLEETKAEIRQRLIGSRREDAINAFLQSFQAQYRAKTICGEEYKVAECANGPATNPTPPPPNEDRPSPDDSDGGADK